jgi:penicillin amidase
MYRLLSRSSFKVTFFISTLLFSLTISLSAWAKASVAEYQFPGLGAAVTVHEDALGIPTIVAESEQDAVFVLGFLHARDRFFQMDHDRKLVAGRLSELLGSAALTADVTFRTFGLDRAALETWQAFPEDTKGVFQSYANGVNAYLATGPLPPEYTALELSKTDPWTPLDTILIGKGLGAQFSIGSSIPDIDLTITLGTYQGFGAALGFDGAALFFEDTHRSAPPDDRVSIPGFLGSIGGLGSVGDSSAEASGGQGKETRDAFYAGLPTITQETMDAAKGVLESFRASPDFMNWVGSTDDPKGSNMWMVSGEHTESGYPLIANDPHLSMNTPAIWYEAQLVYPKGDEMWHVSGVGPAGTSGILLGCNNVACWGFTVNPMDQLDVFSEQVLTNLYGLPTHTVYQGNAEPLQVIHQSFFVNGIGDGIPDTIGRAPVPYDGGGITFVSPRRNNGPILNIDGNSALIAQYVGFGPTFELEMSRRMNQAGSLEEFKASLQHFDIGIQNVFYADTEGNIAYFTTSENPIRSDLSKGTVDGLPPWFIRDGTGAADNEWLPVMNPQPNQALRYEIMPMDEMPHLVNPASGFVVNANNDPIGTTLDNNPVNQLRPGGNGLYYLNPGYSSYRMGRADREIKALVDSGVPITMEDFAILQANDDLLDAELVLPQLLAAMDGFPVPEGSPMAQAMAVLSSWDYSTPTGIAEGYDAGDDPFMMAPPSQAEIDNSVAATVFALWRSYLVRNTIDATLTGVGLGDNLPGSTQAYNAFKHHLDNFGTAGGVGASGLPFFSAGLTETVVGSLQQALDQLASDEFAPAFANSTDVMDYRWGKLHRIVFDHRLNMDPFNVPNGGGFTDLDPGLPDPTGQGSGQTVDASTHTHLPGLSRQGGYQAVDASSHSARSITLNSFMFGSGPSRRFVGSMVPGDVEAWNVIPGGQSGLFYHPNYSSQLSLWLTNNYHQMPLGAADGAASAFMTYTFGPLNSMASPVRGRLENAGGGETTAVAPRNSGAMGSMPGRSGLRSEQARPDHRN